MAFLAFLAFLWLVVPPVLGIMAFFRSQRIRHLESELDGLKRRLAKELAGQRQPDQPPPETSENRALNDPTGVTSDETPPLREDTYEAPDSPRTEAAFVPSPPSSPIGAETHHVDVDKTSGIDWERLIAANWMVWIGGLALALGGLFLVRAAIESGFFGPITRTLTGGVLGAALTFISFHAAHWKPVKNGTQALRTLPSILAGAGTIILYGALLAAGVLYGLLSPLMVLLAFIVVSAWAIFLSLRHGPVIAAIGLAGAYLSPFFTGADGGSPIVLLPFAAAVTTAGLILVHLKGWRFMSWLMLAGSLLWGVVGVISTDPMSPWAVPLYALSIGLIASLISQSVAHEPIFEQGLVLRVFSQTGGASLVAAHLIWLCAGALIVFSTMHWNSAEVAISAASLFGGLGLLFAWRREGFALFAPVSALVSFLVVVLWLDWRTGQLVYSLAAAIGFFAVGGAIAPRVRVQAPIAAVSALSPPAFLFAAFWRGSEMTPHIIWGAAAAVASVAVLYLLVRQREIDPDFEKHPGAAASYALGASLSAGLAPFLVLSDIWLGSALAVVALAISATHRRFEIPLLRYAGVASAALSTVLLIRPGMLSGAEISSVPVFNQLTFGFGVAVLALGFGARYLLDFKSASRAYEGSAAIIFFALIGLLIRHAAGGGSINGPFAGLGEASGYAIAYLGLAISLAYRMTGPTIVWRGLELVSAVVGAGAICVALSALSWDAADGWPLLNLLFAAFAMPAILLSVYSHVLRRNERIGVSGVLSWLAIAVGFAWITFEVRRLYAGPTVLSGAQASDIEMWTYSAAWLVYAFCLLGWGVWRSRSGVRYASLAVLAATFVKVFLFDLSSLDGVMRALSFLALGGALIGTALFYQRFVFTTPADARQAPQPT